MSNENMSAYQYVNGQLAMTVTTAAGSTGPSGGTVTLGTGSALAGKVGIDQTTPGTTNAVAPISGQAGIAGNTGAAGATTTRVIPASNATGTKSNVNDGASSVTILAANTSRRGFCIWNDSPSTLYLDLSGGTATPTSASLPIVPSAVLYEPSNPYTGLITGIWSADASGAARVTEFT